MLALEIEFLLGRYSAADFRERDKPEWPPHPSRLFSALTAATYEAGLGESARAALLWLENQPAPEISASRAAAQSQVTAFVPVNDPSQDYFPGRAERQPRSFPSVVPERPTVFFTWPGAQPDADLLRLFGRIAESVTYLGNSRSPVRVRLCDQPPPPTWVPDDTGTEILRVPGPGRLERLEWTHQNGLRPPAGVFQSYGRLPGQRAEVSPVKGDFGEMIVFRLAGPPRMEVETTLKLTDTMRAAVLSLAGEGGAAVPDLLSGHGGHPHMAYAALPFVSEKQRHADGHILGLAAVFPARLDPGIRRQVLRALAGLDHLNVVGVGQIPLERVTAQSANLAFNLRPRTWTRPSTCWTSATPVLLDRFPKKNKETVEDIISRSCQHAGLPKPTRVSASHYSRLHGVEPSGRFIKVRQAGDLPRLSTHVTLAFDRPIQGPVLIGAGRFFGLGLMRPFKGRTREEDQGS
jgi:CRISPR-associated protein Csb2